LRDVLKVIDRAEFMRSVPNVRSNKVSSSVKEKHLQTSIYSKQVSSFIIDQF